MTEGGEGGEGVRGRKGRLGGGRAARGRLGVDTQVAREEGVFMARVGASSHQPHLRPPLYIVRRYLRRRHTRGGALVRARFCHLRRRRLAGAREGIRREGCGGLERWIGKGHSQLGFRRTKLAENGARGTAFAAAAAASAATFAAFAAFIVTFRERRLPCASGR